MQDQIFLDFQRGKKGGGNRRRNTFRLKNLFIEEYFSRKNFVHRGFVGARGCASQNLAIAVGGGVPSNKKHIYPP